MKKLILTATVTILFLSVIALSCKSDFQDPKPSTNVSNRSDDVEPEGFQSSTNARTNASNTPGWASQTAFRAATTSVQMNIVRLASLANGRLSGASVIDTQNKWLTDVADGDGQRMRNAISKYDKWYKTSVKTKCATPTVPASVRNEMYNSFNGSAYDATRRNLLINQIIARYNSLACYSTVVIPTNDNSTLSFLNIQKQCLEWAESLARTAGGSARGYSASAVSSTSNYRPGMALYKTDRSHAMLITDIYWDSKGAIAKVKVAESNYGSGWSNPIGMQPWSRTVSVGREITSLSGYKVVSFE